VQGPAERRKVFAALDLAFNSLLFCGIGILMLIGLLMP
jgi:hypothetical protein